MTAKEQAFWAALGRDPWRQATSWRTSRGTVIAIGVMPMRQVISTMKKLERTAATVLGVEWEAASPATRSRVRVTLTRWAPAYEMLRVTAAGHAALPPPSAARLATLRRTLPAAWQARLHARRSSG